MITIYKDQQANAIFIEDANGVQFLNSLQATFSWDDCSITDLAKDIEIVSFVNYSVFVDESGISYWSNASDVCNALNAIFQVSGTPSSNVPSITSPLTINLVQGQTLNYELTADFGVWYEWDLSNVPGVTNVEGNVRKLIGGSSLANGTYNIPVKAINYNWDDSETIVLNVSNPSFANSKSVRFNNSDWLWANAGILQNVLWRTWNGSWSSDAWTISFYFKWSNANQWQTIFYFWDGDAANGGYIQLMQINNSGNGSKLLRLKYWSNNNNLRLQTTPGTIVPGVWNHVVVCYDGWSTWSSSWSLNTYYSRFKIYIDWVLQTTNNSHSNYWYTWNVDPDNLRVWRFVSWNYMRNNCKVDELAIWDSDQSSNISSIYNGWSPTDLMNLSSKPKHWWRMGDGDTFPNLQDRGSEANCVFVMNNMTSADIVSDVP